MEPEEFQEKIGTDTAVASVKLTHTAECTAYLPYTMDRMARTAENRDYCVGTGFLSKVFLLSVLTEAGYSGVAYKMLECGNSPSCLYEVNAGAATIWKTWDGEVSRNHYSPGAVCQWLFDTVAGIRPDGERHFLIRPIPGGTLTNAGVKYRSVYGMIENIWKITDVGTEYEITVPSNTTAAGTRCFTE